MNVLLIGSGGREHALAWKISLSPKLNKLFIAPGNAGTAGCGTNIPLHDNDFVSIKSFVLQHEINMVIVGPETPLVQGIHDFFLDDEALNHIAVIGPTRAGAILEGSKDFAKGFMTRYNIPTARYHTFTRGEINHGIAFLKKLSPPFVLKADGLAAGKGVIICTTLEEAENELIEMLHQEKFGDAGKKVVIEEFLEGIECSVFILTDGKNYLLLPSAKDYKRIGEGDTGQNTGGMGSVSPAPFADHVFMQKVEERIIKPTLSGLNKDSVLYKGFIFFGLMNVNGDPVVIEYNVRMGDPEAESILPKISSDLLDLFDGVAKGTLKEKILIIDDRITATIMLASEGYPGPYETGKEISGIDLVKNSIVFHAGTTLDKLNGKIRTNGGRVIGITSFGVTLSEALKQGYQSIEHIHFEGMYYRKDIGKDLLYCKSNDYKNI